MGQTAGEHFDCIIVGSGFGGAVSAYRLAEAGRSVLLLERGKAYPPGAFPRSPNGIKQQPLGPERGAARDVRRVVVLRPRGAGRAAAWAAAR